MPRSGVLSQSAKEKRINSAKQLIALIVLMATGAFATSTLAREQLKIDFTQDEEFLILEGQDGWIQPIPFPTADPFPPGAIVNTHDPGLGGTRLY